MKFADKYAPRSFDDLVIEKENIRSRLKQYADGTRSKHLLIYGPTGTGKSAVARVILESRCCSSCIALQGPYEGSNFTIADLNAIISHWNLQFFGGAKIGVTVINEIDLLSPSLREKLKSFMDEYGHIGQIIATTNNLHALSAPIQRRFDKIELPSLTFDGCLERAQYILNAEGIEMSDDDLRDHFEDFAGDLDDMVSIIEDIVMNEEAE